MNKLIILFLAFLLIQPLHAATETSMSKFVDYVQTKYANKFKEHPILILNKDELNWELGSKNLFGDDKKEERYSVIKSYIKSKSGVELTFNEIVNVDTYISILKNSAVALPLTEGWYSNKKYRICVVFHADPSSNQRLESERVLGLKTKEAYGNNDFSNLQHRLKFEEMKKFSLYHELGHCMDKTFMPDLLNSHDDSHGVHKSEAFAETAGLFFLAREGITNVANNRAKMRTVYSRKMGKFFIDNPQNGFGNPNFKFGGMIYNLAPVLIEGDKVLSNNPNIVTNVNVDKMLSVAANIVKEKAIPFRAFMAIHMFMDKGAEAAINHYEEYERDMPDLFEGIVDHLKKYITYSSDVLDQAFTLLPDPNNPTDNLMPLEMNIFCDAITSNDPTAFATHLESLRVDLEKSNALVENQRERQKSLIDIHEIAAKECH
ncbi:MAG: hypothetical protein KC493_10195 [Bacteriovoracaceae bacterium]|nr:hypothetical protein [Bacteriovoracaceae bacterium]